MCASTLFIYLLFLQSALLPPFQSSLLGGVGVVEVTVGAVAAAVLIRGDVEPSHFGLLHADRKCASGAGFLLSLAAHWPSRLQACEGRGGVRTAAPAPDHVTPAGGAARLIHPPPGEWKSTRRARGGGAAKGGKVPTKGAARTKMRPPRRPLQPPRRPAQWPPTAGACLQATRRALQPPWVSGSRPLLCPGRNWCNTEGRLSNPRR